VARSSRLSNRKIEIKKMQGYYVIFDSNQGDHADRQALEDAVYNLGSTPRLTHIVKMDEKEMDKAMVAINKKTNEL